MIKRKDIEKIVKLIAEKYEPEKIFLFGSFAWGNPSENSDIDLFIVKKSEKTSIKMMQEIYEIIFDEGKAVDVLVYTPEQVNRRKELGDPFVLNIINNGKLLYATK